MSETTKWKSRLLSSSVPLEYEVAKILRSLDFSVSADFPYHRLEAGIEKEFSVDIRGVFTSGKYSDEGTCRLDALVECKYRHPGVKWLFLPHPDSSASGSYPPFQYVDAFASSFVHDILWDVGDVLHVGYKGIEIASGDDKEKVLDSQLRHGFAQLQFALPSIVALRVRGASFNPASQSKPFFFVPILVTNAELLIAPREFSSALVRQAESVDQLGSRVGAMTFNLGTGPDFDRHATAQLSELQNLVTSKTMQEIEHFRRKAGVLEYELPSWLAKRIARNGEDAAAIADFGNILICHVDSLRDSLLFVLEAFRRAVKSLKAEPIVKFN